VKGACICGSRIYKGKFASINQECLNCGRLLEVDMYGNITKTLENDSNKQ